MALCVRRAPGLRGRWKSGVRGAGGAAGRLREGSRVRDAVLYQELRPCPWISTPVRRPVPPTAITLLPHSRPVGIRLSLPISDQDRAVQRLKDIIVHNKLTPHPVSQFSPSAKSSDTPPVYREWEPLGTVHHLDCCRSLFQPGLVRNPYPAPEFLARTSHDGLLEFSLSTKTMGSPATGNNQSDMEEHLAVMHEKLREELPRFLWKSANMTLYRRDMEFISSMLNIHLRGIVKYQLFVSLTRLLLLCYYLDAGVSVLKLTSHPETNSIHARWSFSGLPLHCIFFYPFKKDKKELYRTFDAFSTFHLAPDGLISVHKVERVMPSSPLAVSKKTILAAALLALGLSEDRPALNLLSAPKLPHEL